MVERSSPDSNAKLKNYKEQDLSSFREKSNTDPLNEQSLFKRKLE